MDDCRWVRDGEEEAQSLRAMAKQKQLMTDLRCEASDFLDGRAADNQMTQPSSQLSRACLQSSMKVQ